MPNSFMTRLAPRHPQQMASVSNKFHETKSVAVLLAPRLGDSLLTLIIANNLVTSGREVQVFGNYAYQLSNLFPGFTINQALTEAEAKSRLQAFDAVVQMHPRWPFDPTIYHEHAISLDSLLHVTGRGFTKTDQIALFCRHFLGLSEADIDNGMRSPDITCWRKHPERIILHPTSTGAQRCWASKHFGTLATKLKAKDFQPCFIVSPDERPDWLWVLEHGFNLPETPSLADVASLIHNSGWFIGNESGIGHLASSLGIPTVTVTGRPTRTRCWLPGWTAATFVYPLWLPGGRLRDRYWRTVLSPNAVMRAFNQFRKQLGNINNAPERLTASY